MTLKINNGLISSFTGLKIPGTGLGFAGSFRQGALLNYLIRWGFWSLESDNDYYASLEDGTPIYSLTEKE